MSQLVLALKYPDRAESLTGYERYRVFLDHWDPLIAKLAGMRRALFARRESRTLGIYAPQGSGKTLLARQLVSDVKRHKEGAGYDNENLWHRIARDNLQGGSSSLASTSHLKVLLRDAGLDADWSNELDVHLQTESNRAIVLMDEADQAYFQARLLGMELVDYLKFEDQGRLLKAAADKFVKLCRTTWRGAVFVMLSNRRDFLDGFSKFVNGQHNGMMSVENLPAADAQTKERVVRINTNRLNPFSYWYCINNALPDLKSGVYDALAGADTFPDAFQAVDAAVGGADKTRGGRPALKNNLTLVVLHQDPPGTDIVSALGEGDVEFDEPYCKIRKWSGEWASSVLSADMRQSAAMLESEWSLRIVLLSGSAIAGIVDPSVAPDVVRNFLSAILDDVPSPYWQAKRCNELTQRRRQALTALTSATSQLPTEFWSRGQSRSSVYEPRLKLAYPTFNTGLTQVSGFRPDVIISDYTPCSVVEVGSRDASAITEGNKRIAHFVEVTSTSEPNKVSVLDYLAQKLGNYVKLMESV